MGNLTSGVFCIHQREIERSNEQQTPRHQPHRHLLRNTFFGSFERTPLVPFGPSQTRSIPDPILRIPPLPIPQPSFAHRNFWTSSAFPSPQTVFPG